MTAKAPDAMVCVYDSFMIHHRYDLWRTIPGTYTTANAKILFHPWVWPYTVQKEVFNVFWYPSLHKIDMGGTR